MGALCVHICMYMTVIQKPYTIEDTALVLMFITYQFHQYTYAGEGNCAFIL